MDDPSRARTLFAQFVLPHLDGAYNVARWLLRHEQDAEDAVQEACMRTYGALARFRAGDARAWLLTIVRNVCYSRLRRLRGSAESEAFDDEVHGVGQQPTGLADLEDRLGELRECVERLPAEFREVLVLRELEQLSYREIADVAGIPLGTVMSRLARARHRLQAEMLRKGAPGQEDPTHGL